MTLTAEQSSNKAQYEAASTAEIIDIIRTAMGEGCIRPCHVYDAVDELICRIQALENRPKRNCDVGTTEEQAQRFMKVCESVKPAEPHYSETGELLCPSIGSGHECKLGVCNFGQCALKWAQMPYKEGGAK